jgi:hypothetical protein
MKRSNKIKRRIAMKAKRIMIEISSAITMLLMSTTGAFAADTHKVYSSGILVLLFLGFCALVVVMQTIPAMMHLYGMIKGATSKKSELAEVKSH